MKIALLVAGAAALAVAGHGPIRRAAHAMRALAAPSGNSASGATPIDPKTVPAMRLGMNLSVAAPWSTEEIFNDPLKTHGGLDVDDAHKALVSRDANGWLLNVPAGTTIMVGVGLAKRIAGSYDCTISPDWAVHGLAVDVAQNGTRFTVLRSASNLDGGANLALSPLKPGIDLKELSCQRRGLPQDALFRADFLKDVQPFRILRFMNLMRANEDRPGTWAARPTPGRLGIAASGIPLEWMVQLANENHSDPWFTLPLGADEDYLRRFASYVRDHLDPKQKAYIEVSNEIWNGSFPQSKTATMLGKLKYPAAADGDANDFYYGDRIRAVMAVWSEVFAGQTQRIVRVASTMAAWSARGDTILGHNQTWRSVDALAIAPYFGEVPNDVLGKGTARVDGIIAKTPQYIAQAMDWSKANKLVANKYGVRLIAYEGGPGYWGFEPDMLKDVDAASHDPRLTPLYKGFLERWRREIGGEFVTFDSMDGIYGHLDYTGQPWSASPKMRAVTEFIATLPAK